MADLTSTATAIRSMACVGETVELVMQCGIVTTYATLEGMIERFDPEEMAQHSSRQLETRVPGDLFNAAIRGDDISGWTLDEQTATAAAIKVMCRALHDSDSFIDGHLKDFETPLESPPDIVTNTACDIARYYLYDSGELADDNIVQRRYKQALLTLKDIVAGKIKVGEVVNEIGSPATEAPDRVFTSSTLSDYMIS